MSVRMIVSIFCQYLRKGGKRYIFDLKEDENCLIILHINRRNRKIQQKRTKAMEKLFLTILRSRGKKLVEKNIP